MANLNPFKPILDRIGSLAGPRLDQAAAYATWGFLVLSIGLLVAAVARVDGNLGQVVGVVQISQNGSTHSPPGLTYAGETGMLRGVLQLLIVAIAAGCSVTPFRRLARLGRGVVLGWAAWWAGNFAWLAATTGHPGAALIAGGCVAATAGAAWRFRRMGPALATLGARTPRADAVELAPDPGLGFDLDPAAADDAGDPDVDLTPSDITWSTRMREVAAKAQGPLGVAVHTLRTVAARAHGHVRDKMRGVAERTRAREV